jgi:glyoxylase-like metal-dependent hydrolase (beta-lactamase superfamily II)
MRIGDLVVISLLDGMGSTPVEHYPPHADTMHADLIKDGRMDVPIGCFLVRTGGMNVLIDAGMGPLSLSFDTGRAAGMCLEGGKLPAALAAVGLKPDDIDLIVPTHMHLDHAGWIIQEGAPFFSKAKVRFGAGDWDAVVETSTVPGFVDGMRALREAGRVELIERDGEVAPGVSAMGTPGHTPGHHSIVLSSGEQRAMIFGDIITCPFQIEAPEGEAMADMDKKLAAATRERMLRELDGDTLVGGPHFPGLRFGRVLMGQGRRYWGG